MICIKVALLHDIRPFRSKSLNHRSLKISFKKSHWTAPKRSLRTDTRFRKSSFSHPYLAWWSPNTYVFARNHQPHDRTTNSWECTKSPSANSGDPAHSLVLIFAASESYRKPLIDHSCLLEFTGSDLQMFPESHSSPPVASTYGIFKGAVPLSFPMIDPIPSRTMSAPKSRDTRVFVDGHEPGTGWN